MNVSQLPALLLPMSTAALAVADLASDTANLGSLAEKTPSFQGWDLRPVGGWYVVVLAILLIASLGAIQAVRHRLNRWRMLAITTLRLLAALVVLFLMLRLSLVYVEIEKQPATFVFAIDTSRSMSIGDVLGGSQTRWEAIGRQMEAVLPTLKKLHSDEALEIKICTFDRDARIAVFDGETLPLPEQAEGEQSAIGSALGRVLQDAAGKKLAGVVLLSDGAQRADPTRNDAPDLYAAQMQQAGVPLYTVVFGESGAGEVRDVALDDLLVNPTVFVKNELPVSASARVTGYSNKPVLVELLFENAAGEMITVDEVPLETAEGRATLPVDLGHIPDVPGEYKLTVRAPPLDGELVETNNEVSTFVTVLKGGVNVLYAYGNPLPEHKFIRWSLDASQNIQLDTYHLKANSPNPLEALPEDAFDPGRYDVYILTDLYYQKIFGDDDQYLKKLGQLVTEHGAGVMMTGGVHSFGPGGWQHLGVQPESERLTRRQERELFQGVLPVGMDRTNRQNFNDPIQPDLHLSGPQRMVPTRDGLRHFVMLLGPRQKNRETWEDMPPLKGGNRLVNPAPLASVLARNEQGDPFLLAHEAGKGRSMAFAGDTTWRWWLRPGGEGKRREHKRFWRQCVLWLAHKDQQDTSGVWVRLAERRFRPSDRVEITVGADSPEGDPIAEATFQAQVTMPNGKQRPLRLNPRGDYRSGVFLETQLSGDYTVSVEGFLADGTQIGTATARFLVEAQDLELDNPQANPGLMARLAKMTGGKKLHPEELPPTIEELAEQGLNTEIETVTKREPWDEFRWVWFSVFCSLLMAEWYLRKRWGLV